jgi:hypothetical protein
MCDNWGVDIGNKVKPHIRNLMKISTGNKTEQALGRIRGRGGDVDKVEGGRTPVQ